MDPTRPSNRLIFEKSPYLLQHAHNPVDWYPWRDEAFSRALRESKPVFLSIGYSTCHWCHVMERESFTDETVARLLNEAFICVKVDREERPDLDQHYMDVCQRLTGSGGWPLTIVMTPGKLPFFAGTYFPKEHRWGRVGLLELLPRLRDVWRLRRDEVLRSADAILRSTTVPGPRVRTDSLDHKDLGLEAFDAAFRELKADFDEWRGGFGRAPKFPIPHALAFLLRYWKRTGTIGALAMVERTLGAMRNGGIFDHLGFGFHRYATDAEWLIPHFEKMLYDQALLTEAYTDAFLATGKDEYRRTAEETMAYVLRDLVSPEGAFLTAEDADSEGEEGRFYLWTREDIAEVLGPEEADLAARVFNVAAGGNFAEPGRERDGRNILHRAVGDRLAPESIRRALFLAREKRVHPFKDGKVLADWNGLAIAALARLFSVTQKPRYSEAAERAAQFILERMRAPDGRLLHMFADGQARVPAFLDDYAFFIRGLIDVYQSGFNLSFLKRALGLMDQALELLWDGDGGGFFFAPVSDDLPVRRKEIYDGAVPSGNSVMLMNLLRLARLTGRQELEEKAAHLARAFSAEVGTHPRAHTEFLQALDFALGPSQEVVIVGEPDDARTGEFLKELARTYLPNTVVLFKAIGKGRAGGEEDSPLLSELAPFTRNMEGVGGGPAAYICSKGQCLRPVAYPAELLSALKIG